MSSATSSFAVAAESASSSSSSAAAGMSGNGLSSNSIGKENVNNNAAVAMGQLFGGCKSVDIYEKCEKVGEGMYGEVWRAKRKMDSNYRKQESESVALKKIRMENEKEGFPITAIREIKLLQGLNHENVVKLKEMVTFEAKDKKPKDMDVYMVFEYLEHDLTGLQTNRDHKFQPSPAQIKCYLKQLLEGLHFCHSKNVLHRDIKGSNLLINKRGQLKLADFGLARTYSDQQKRYTNKVVTLWYRPPELLLGAIEYGPAIDIWSAGCILAELLIGQPLFPGKNEMHELELIWGLCGTPTMDNWPSYTSLPNANLAKVPFRASRLREKFAKFPPETIALLEQMLQLDPSKRITASKALDHDYFWKLPLPCEPYQLPSFPSSHEWGNKLKQGLVQPAPQQPNQPPPNYSNRSHFPSGQPILRPPLPGAGGKPPVQPQHHYNSKTNNNYGAQHQHGRN